MQPFTSILVQSLLKPALSCAVVRSLAYPHSPPCKVAKNCQSVKGRLVGHPLACVSALRLFRTLRPHKGMTCQHTSILFRWCNCARRRRSALRPLCDRGNFRKSPYLLHSAIRLYSCANIQPLFYGLGAFGRPPPVLLAFQPIAARTR